MHQYVHQSGAIVCEDDNGRKRLYKHGLIFRTFKEIADYEQQNQRVISQRVNYQIIKNTESEFNNYQTQNRQDLLRQRALAKGEER